MQPFHFAFTVRDLDSTRAFYRDLLGCPEGRSTETWVDFDFFGNQISAHVSEHPVQAHKTGKVDEVEVPIPHFGAVLSWEQFERLSERLVSARISFLISPRIRFAGAAGEQRTMFLLDFSGNALEFKSFRNEGAVFASGV